MVLAAGIDLGVQGALCVIDTDTRRIVSLWDMPTYQKKRGKGMRSLIDAHKLCHYIQTFADIGVVLVTIEEPGFRQGQKGSGTVGFGAGLVVMGVIAADPPIRYEMAAPSAWKASLRLTGPKSYSVRRAQEIWPAQENWFVGPMGGGLDGRAEAALICEYGIGRHLGLRR